MTSTEKKQLLQKLKWKIKSRAAEYFNYYLGKVPSVSRNCELCYVKWDPLERGWFKLNTNGVAKGIPS